jgi:hypothetical protein
VTMTRLQRALVARFGAGCWVTYSSGKRNAVRAAQLNASVDPVRVTHPFHPWQGRELDVLRRDFHYGEDRVFYRSQYGHVCSLPTAWTSLSARPVYESEGRAPFFLVDDLLELVELVRRGGESFEQPVTEPGKAQRGVK